MRSIIAAVFLGLLLPHTVSAEYFNFGTGGGDDFYTAIGRTSNFIRFGQKFTTTQSATEISGHFLIQRSNTTDNLILQVQTDNGGIPSDTVLASSTWAYSAVTNANCGTDTSISLASTTVSLAADTTYWIVFSKAGLSDSSNYYKSCQKDGGTADAKALLNGSWGITNNDYYNIVGNLLTDGTDEPPPGGGGATSSIDIIQQLNVVNLTLALLLGLVAFAMGYIFLKYGF